MSTAPSDDTGSLELDPVFLNSKREAWIILGLWGAMLLWAVPYCYINGFQAGLDPEEVELTFGLPSWVFWGIAFPWLVADVFTIWFCLLYMKKTTWGLLTKVKISQKKLPRCTQKKMTRLQEGTSLELSRKYE